MCFSEEWPLPHISRKVRVSGVKMYVYIQVQTDTYTYIYMSICLDMYNRKNERLDCGYEYVLLSTRPDI